MRLSSICPKCDHHEVLQVKLVPDMGEIPSEIRPLRVAVREIVPAPGFWSGRRSNLEVVGQLKAAVCRQCGFTEFYTAKPEAIPVDGNHVTLTVGRPAAEGPFR